MLYSVASMCNICRKLIGEHFLNLEKMISTHVQVELKDQDKSRFASSKSRVKNLGSQFRDFLPGTG